MKHPTEYDLHVGQCGHSDQITVEGDETVYDVGHVTKCRKTGGFELHTMCGKVLKFGMWGNVRYVGNHPTSWKDPGACPVCKKVLED